MTVAAVREGARESCGCIYECVSLSSYELIMLLMCASQTVIAYLMRSEQLSFEAALEDVRQHRPQARCYCHPMFHSFSQWLPG